MKVRTWMAICCAAAASAARADDASIGIEATIGAQRLGLQHATVAHETLQPMGDLGATVLLRGDALELGVAAEGNFDHTTLQRYNASVLGGLGFDLVPVLRLEVLGEYGAANLRTTADVRAAATSDGSWHRFYGVRPGLSVKLPAFPLRVGVWGLARWGLPGTTGGPAYGMLGRIGLDF
jgi:hypothetical protein